MELQARDEQFEALNKELLNPEQLEAYKKPYDDFPVLLIPKILGKFLVWIGNVVYGEGPSYMKFRAIEVIARIPYQSWSSAAYTLLTLFYSNEKKAEELSNTTKFARFSLDNETMHVVVISHITKEHKKPGFIRYTFVPMFFAFFYFWATYWLYLIRPRWSLELNYLFEQHAFDQYSQFLKMNGEALRKLPMESNYLAWYGRDFRNQFEFFQSIRNDEIVHRNESVREINEEIDGKHIHFWKRAVPTMVIIIVVISLVGIVF